jgi:predicted secreted hydrolase
LIKHRNITTLLSLLMILGSTSCSTLVPPDQAASIVLQPATLAPESFQRALAPVPIQLPRDHGPHLNFQTEWWYYTGNVQTDDGRRFGYQLTIFRRGLSPGVDQRAAGFSTNQVYFAHFALTDIEAGKHMAAERFSRAAAGLAGGSGEPFRVWLEDWSVESLNTDGSFVRVKASEPRYSLELVLEAQKPIVLHGEQGLSAKSNQPGNASYYLSYTRMQTGGTISVGNQSFDVEGSSWFDHEWSTSALDEADVGWDWFGLQLNDGSELMLYLIRRADGSVEPISGGTLVNADGRSTPLDREDVRIGVEQTWTSPHSGAEYPAAWQIDLPAYDLSLQIRPQLPDQELQVSFTYWEGAVSVTGTSAGRPIEGQGYVELTGYDASMGGVF